MDKQTVVYLYNDWQQQQKELLTKVATWMNLKCIISYERSQTQKPYIVVILFNDNLEKAE